MDTRKVRESIARLSKAIDEWEDFVRDRNQFQRNEKMHKETIGWLKHDIGQLIEEKKNLQQEIKMLKSLKLPYHPPSEWRRTTQTRPSNSELIFYYSEPAGAFYVGTYDAERDGVHNHLGICITISNIPFWMPVPDLPKD